MVLKNSTKLKDFEVNIKIKLAFLWASVTFLYIYGDYFELYIPKKVERLMNGQNLLDNPIKLFAASILLAIPSLMIFLSVALKPLFNKWLNIIFGFIYTALMLLIAFTSIEPWRAFYVFYAILESIITTLVIWYAWHWEKE
jgi:Family of unknown function (DUF6326)